MKSFWFAGVALSLTALGLAGVSSLHRERPAVFHEENILGTSFEFKAVATTPAIAAQAESAALSQIAHDAALLSSWDTNSEFSRWFRTKDRPIAVSPELAEVLALFDQW